MWDFSECVIVIVMTEVLRPTVQGTNPTERNNPNIRLPHNITSAVCLIGEGHAKTKYLAHMALPLALYGPGISTTHISRPLRLRKV